MEHGASLDHALVGKLAHDHQGWKMLTQCSRELVLAIDRNCVWPAGAYTAEAGTIAWTACVTMSASSQWCQVLEKHIFSVWHRAQLLVVGTRGSLFSWKQAWRRRKRICLLCSVETGDHLHGSLTRCHQAVTDAEFLKTSSAQLSFSSNPAQSNSTFHQRNLSRLSTSGRSHR